MINKLEITRTDQTLPVPAQPGIVVRQYGFLYVTNSTVHRNNGAANILNQGGTILINSTVSGNNGHGIMNAGSLEWAEVCR